MTVLLLFTVGCQTSITHKFAKRRWCFSRNSKVQPHNQQGPGFSLIGASIEELDG